MLGIAAIISLILFVSFLLVYQMMQGRRDETLRTLSVEARFFLTWREALDAVGLSE